MAKEKKSSVNGTTGINSQVPNEWYYGVTDTCIDEKVKNGRKPTIHDMSVKIYIEGCKALKIKPRKF